MLGFHCQVKGHLRWIRKTLDRHVPGPHAGQHGHGQNQRFTARLRTLRTALHSRPGHALAAQGVVTGASGRNWAGYGAQVRLPEGFAAEDRALLTDPQTSGGLLIACAPELATEVLSIFLQQGFERQPRPSAGCGIGNLRRSLTAARALAFGQGRARDRGSPHHRHAPRGA